MKRFLGILALAAMAGALFAQTLSVTATDNELGMPLEGVRVTLAGNGASAVTDTNGKASLELPANFSGGVVSAESPGYLTRRVSIKKGQTSLEIALSITEYIEGKELVVERTIPGKTDEKSGVSVVMDSKDMKTTAQFGLVEDIMSSIKTLPGVGFSGGFSAQPSIRGGYPAEMGTTLDDVYILSPFHWGGAFSIFNPNMVESAKMSHGIFSARYGRAMSGLLEVTTVKPDKADIKINGGISTIATDLFVQAPIGQKAGLFFGGKVTYLETLQILNDEILGQKPKLSETTPTMPYIRDFFLKLMFEPSKELTFSVNGFIGTDGVGAKDKAEKDGVKTEGYFDWENLVGFGSINLKWMPSDITLVRFVGAYNNQTSKAVFENYTSGSHAYSQGFIDTYGGLIGGNTSYNLNGLDLDGGFKQTIQQVQGKLETDIQLSKENIITVGVEEVFHFANIKEAFTGFQVYEDSSAPYPELTNQSYSINVEGNSVVNSSAYALWNFGNEQTTLSGELGLRAEHYYLWNKNYDFKTRPVVDPRASANWTPVKNYGALEKLTFSAGTGFFSMFPVHLLAAEDKYGIDDYGIDPNRAWFQVVGIEAFFPDTWSFRLEGYYKYYFNRLYITGFYNPATGKLDIGVKDDGVGHVTGFDLMLRKKQGRWIDGYLSYSFVYARYKNPTEARGEEDRTVHGDPLNEWYYPDFHRFHTLNLVLNYRPSPGWTLSLMGSLATGMPERKTGDIVMTPVMYNGQIIEQYRRASFYSDTLRTDISCPVDVRLSYGNYYKNSKLRWEYYIGAEDILVNLYTPKTTSNFDPYTGEEIKDSNSADFNIGIPVI